MEPADTPPAPCAPDSVKDVIDLWPTRRACADALGVTKARVDKWAQAGSIPARYHRRLIVAAKAAGFASVSADLLADLHADLRSESDVGEAA